MPVYHEAEVLPHLVEHLSALDYPNDKLQVLVLLELDDTDTIACIQARLNYFNADENLLTRCFTLEYSLWFDEMLPGLDSWHLPIALGGTSNHFSTPALRYARGWDPYNVTEDADLGLRAAAQGLRVGGSMGWLALPHWAKQAALANLVLGNGTMIVLSALAARRRRAYDLIPFALLNPAYWILHSIAAWRALFQLVRSPGHREKTPHGLRHGPDARSVRNAEPQPAGATSGRPST